MTSMTKTRNIKQNLVLRTPAQCSGYVAVMYELVCVRIGAGTTWLDTTLRNESYDVTNTTVDESNASFMT